MKGLLKVLISAFLFSPPLFFSVFFALQGSPAFSEERNALLIANAKYKYFENLETPVNEARELKKALEALGFKVIILENAGKSEMEKAFADFSGISGNAGNSSAGNSSAGNSSAGGNTTSGNNPSSSGASGISLIHYGGHAIQTGNSLYLIPVDVKITDEKKVPSRALDVKLLFRALQGKTNIAALDACRNNPLAKKSSDKVSGNGASYASGNASAAFSSAFPVNSIVIFSSEPGKIAKDDVFTPVLTEKIREKKSITQIFNIVQSEVRNITDNEQSPVIYNQLKASVFLAGKPEPEKIPSKDPLLSSDIYEIDYSYLGKVAFDKGQYVKAFEYFLKEELTDDELIRKLAWLYQTGKGGLQDDKKALSLYEKSASLGNVSSQYEAGVIYYTGRGTEINYKKARSWFEKAAKKGNDDAQAFCGYLYYEGLGGAQNYKTSKKWFEKSAQNGNAFSQNYLGLLYKNGDSVTQDFNRAFEWFTKSAEGGCVEGLYNLALMYEEGLGTQKNMKKAISLYEKAALGFGGGNASGSGMASRINPAFPLNKYFKTGLPEAKNSLACIYENGIGVSVDYSKAFFWYIKAANQGFLTSMNNLGFMYQMGRGTQQNYKKALELYQKAAEKNHPAALNNLAFLYQNGLGVSVDYKKALSLYEKASSLNYAEAQFNLGYLYETGVKGNGGTIIHADKEKAIQYYSLAAEQGQVEAMKRLEKLQK